MKPVLILVSLLSLFICGSCGSKRATDQGDEPQTFIDSSVGDYEILTRDTDSDPYDNLPIVQSRPDDGTNRWDFCNRTEFILNNMKYTKYSHTPTINEYLGVYVYDCSGFAGEFVLNEVLPSHHNDLFAGALKHHNSGSDLSRPRAWGFYDHFDSLYVHKINSTFWYVFKDIDELQQGDIIVAKYAEDWRPQYVEAEKKDASTGHVMIAWATRESTIDPNRTYVTVVDASGSGHNKDTRDTLADGVSATDGIGRGEMAYVAQGDSIIGYYWSKSTGNMYGIYTGKYDYHKRLQGVIFARVK